MNWKSWFQGLVWAVLTGMGSAVTLIIVDPAHFNFAGQWRGMVSAMFAFGLLAFFTYIKDSRPPSFSEKVVDTVKTGVGVGLVFLAVLVGASTTSACGAPKGVVLTPAGQKAYTSREAIKAVDALSQTARNLNAAKGVQHLSDVDTALVRDFALSAGAGLKSYGLGQGKLQVALDAYHELNRRLSKESRLNDKFRFALALVDGALMNVIP